jgi:hypothetical protein
MRDLARATGRRGIGGEAEGTWRAALGHRARVACGEVHPLAHALVGEILRAKGFAHQTTRAVGAPREQIVSQLVRQGAPQRAWQQPLHHAGQIGKPTSGALGTAQQVNGAPYRQDDEGARTARVRKSYPPEYAACRGFGRWHVLGHANVEGGRGVVARRPRVAPADIDAKRGPRALGFATEAADVFERPLQIDRGRHFDRGVARAWYDRRAGDAGNRGDKHRDDQHDRPMTDEGVDDHTGTLRPASSVHNGQTREVRVPVQRRPAVTLPAAITDTRRPGNSGTRAAPAATAAACLVTNYELRTPSTKFNGLPWSSIRERGVIRAISDS